MGNVYDDLAALADKYGKRHEAAVAAGDLILAERYRAITLDLCGVILKGGKR